MDFAGPFYEILVKRLSGKYFGLVFTKVLLASLFLAACDSNTPKTPPPEVFEIPIPEIDPDTSYQLDLTILEKDIAKRRANKDTIPRKHLELQAILPTQIEGYKEKVTGGNTFINPDFAFSEASRTFYDPEENYLEIHLADYSADMPYLRNLMGRYNAANGVEFEDGKQNRIPPKNRLWAWKTYDPARKMARLEACVDLRFYVQIEATNQTSDQKVLEIWNRLDFSSLISKTH